MNDTELALARILFHLKVHQAKGQAFEDLFVSIYQKAFPNFIPVKPQGQIGDRKNDGYDKTSGTYYQVFAPEDLGASEPKAVKKLNEDFTGLHAYWNQSTPVKSFHFVMNDKFAGSFPEIETHLAEIKKTHNLANCSVLIAKHLEDTLFGLPHDQIMSIVGYVPCPDQIGTLNYSVLNTVIGHIVEFNRVKAAPETLQVPDFSDKIKVNNLSSKVASLLSWAANQVGIFENYFQKNSKFSKAAVRAHLNQIYQNSKTKEYPSPSTGSTKEDYIFMDLLNNAVPKQTQEYINATLIVMAAFFESCDIFEDPGQRSLNL